MDVGGYLIMGHFNPRSHEGSDVNCGSNTICAGYFNPRSHEGSDPGHSPKGEV